MKISNYVCAWSLCAASLLFTACSGLQPSIGDSAAAPASAPYASRAASGRSWMLPAAKNNDILYVSYFYGNDVLAYAYPSGQLVGTITGIDAAQGVCTSKKTGNWWVVATGSSQVLEFAHGGTTPIATLNVTAGVPASCAVEPKTGNLAVTIITNDDVVVYKKGAGPGAIYTAPFQPLFSTYDDKGNLFVDGSGVTPLAELPKGAATFTSISVDQQIVFSGGLQWHGNVLAFGDQDTADIYEFAVSGDSATLTGTTPLTGGSAGGFWIQGRKVISKADGSIGFWKYPAGGSPTKTISGSFYGGIDTIVSAAK